MDPEKVLDFWFGELDEHGHASPESARRWFMKNHEFDREVKSTYEETHAAIARGDLESWLDTPRGRLAYVIVLDQLSRNMFRGTYQMFAHDEQALRAAVEGIDKGDDRALVTAERTFLYMPLMHSESLSTQNRCVALFEKLRDEQPPHLRERFEEHVKYAVMHRDIIQRFGRFPHRNPILDRTSTQEELDFLNEPNSAF